jgi:metal-responsive CopG/Arc/MetJ family transcriptional regulator
MMEPIQRVNVDFTIAMLEELEKVAKELNISRQAVISTLIRQRLDQGYMSRFPERRRNNPKHRAKAKLAS